MQLTTNRPQATPATIDGTVAINENDGTGTIRTYTDPKATQNDIAIQIQRLKNSFDFSDANGAELSLYASEKKLTKCEIQDMVTSVIQSHQYRKVTIADIIRQHNPNIRIVSGFHLRNMPTEKADAEYVRILRRNDCLYYAERAQIETLTEQQKQTLRRIYIQNFPKQKSN